jgi:hypothetical protein
MAKGFRKIPERDISRYWELRAQGSSIRAAAVEIGVNYSTARNWEVKLDNVKVEITRSDEIDLSKVGGTRRRRERAVGALGEAPQPRTRIELKPEAKRGLDDFDYFRRRYLGRAPSPWQVEAAYQIVEMLASPEREFVVLNCPPGAGKSTLWHDVAVWCIVRDRTIRVLIGSISTSLAKQYAGRIRDTLARTIPVTATPEEKARKLAVDAESTLAHDYGRFKPKENSAIWRMEEFVVEQIDGAATNNKEATVAAYGMDAEFIGARANLCLFDDAANSDNARDGVGRDRFLEKWDSVAEARCEPGGLLGVIGQRLSMIDLYAHCLSKKAVLDDADHDDDGTPLETPKYHHIVYPAYHPELDTGPDSRKVTSPPWPNGPLLDPRRIPWRDLAYVRNHSEDRFRLVYQQEDPEKNPLLIRKEWLHGTIGDDGVMYPGCFDRDRALGKVPVGLADPIISIATVDPSPSNYWGIIWWLYQPATGLRHIVDIAFKRMTAEELLGWSIDRNEHVGLMEEWQERSKDLGRPITRWIVEINAAQRFLLAHEFVRRWIGKHRVDIVPHTTGRNKIDDNLGVEALLPPVYRAGLVRIPYGQGGDHWRVDEFIRELVQWSPDRKNGTDLVMAHWFAELHWPNIGPIRPPEKQWRPTWLRQPVG